MWRATLTLLEAKEISPLKIEGLPYFTKSTLRPGYVISDGIGMRRENPISEDHVGENIDAHEGGGLSCSSDEVLVMRIE